jgi:predicted ArsR family transcriptional regulator
VPSRPLSRTEFASAVTAITSAFGDPTRRDIYLFARDADCGVTASEVAQRFDLHPNVARHHLDKLSSGGYLEMSVDRVANSGAGRPSKRYQVPLGRQELEVPVRHDEVLARLLGRALALLPPGTAEQLAEEVGTEYGHVMAEAMGGAEAQRSFRTALHTVAEALTAHGFAAHTESKANGLRIVSDHCPFGDTALEHPVICAVDRGMVKGMLGGLYGATTTATESSVALGDEICATAVKA